MEGYEKNLHISDETFEDMRNDTDRVLQKLIKNMIEKESLEGKLTISIDVNLTREYIPNHDPKIEGESRAVYTPKFSHKVGSVLQIKSETKGEKNYDGMELVWDEEKKEYVLKPIANTAQMTIFDAEYQVVNDDEVDIIEAPAALTGRMVAALPGVVETTEEPADEPEEEVVEPEEAEPEDMSEAFEGEDMPFDGECDYDYDEPDEE